MKVLLGNDMEGFLLKACYEIFRNGKNLGVKGVIVFGRNAHGVRMCCRFGNVLLREDEERGTSLRYEFSVYFRQRRGAVCNTSLQLFSLEMVQDVPETRARTQSQRDKVAARKEWRWNQRLACEFLALGVQEFNVIEHSVTAGAVDTV